MSGPIVHVGISDLQAPLHDPRAVANIARFLKAYKPNGHIMSVGDEIDFPQIGRWNRGLKGEHTLDIGKHRDAAVRVLEELRIEHISTSNHSIRLKNYVERHAPGLDGLDELKIENFLRLPELGITYHHTPFQFAPGWLLMHGDESGISQEPGKTALNLAKRMGASVMCGHSHRQGIQPFTEASTAGVRRNRYGFEVGHLMSLKHASYMMGPINWQQGFGLVIQDGNNVTPVMVPIQKDGSFVVDRKVWGR